MIEPCVADTYRSVLNRLDGLIAREIARLRVRYQLSLDEFRGLYVSDEQVDALLQSAVPQEPAASDAREPLVSIDDPRWRHVVTTFELTAVDENILAIALAPELDLKYETLYAYLNDDVTRKWPTAGLAARLLGAAATRADVLAALAPASRLCRNRLMQAIDAPSSRPSLLNTGFAVAPSVSRFLQGIPVAVDAGRDDEHGPSPDDECREKMKEVARLWHRRDNDMPALVLIGSPGSGRMRAAKTLAAALDTPFRLVDLRAVRREGGSIARELATVALEARLEAALVCVCGVRGLTDGDGRLPHELHGALSGLNVAAAPLAVLAAAGTPWRELLGSRRALILDLTPDDGREQSHVWSEQLSRAGIVLTRDECRALADRFRFTAMQVAQAVETARDWVSLTSPPRAGDFALVRDAARAQAREPLGQLAHVERTRFGWDDLVLPPAVLARLKELASAIRLRHVVYGQWGFAGRFSGGRGVKAMFAGPSGTGKTMAAGVIAAELGLDLIKVDLSGLVSKYIGDTEKNLDRVFASARSGNALLFFDEADAVFGKRSEVKDAHDRYANIEVAYLLQKIEDHDGVVVLATNLRRNMDDAFSRRLHYVVDFPLPDAPLRERLWRGMLPDAAPVADDVDLAFLARQFELAGGDIRNVVLDAAFLAADACEPIGMRHLIRGVARQLSKQGRSPSPTEFQRYFEMVTP
jgi:AAA+ superfamily predicted ATPase